MRKTTSKKLTCLALALLMTLGTAAQVMTFADDAKAEDASGLKEISEALSSINYAEYKDQHADASRGTSTVSVKAVDYIAEETDASVKVESNYMGKSGQSLIIEDDGQVSWKVDIPKTGLYAIKIDYCSVSEKTNSIERTLYINGKVPFSEARYLMMKKLWKNEYVDGRFKMDGNGNELRPTSSVDHVWQEYAFIDSNGYYANPFEFYLEKGENVITLGAVREPMAIQNITIYPYEDKITYEEYAAGKSAGTDTIKISAETPSATSDYTVYPVYDRKSAITEPQHNTKILLNTIGGEKWTKTGQFVEYKINVESEGLYQIIPRFRQNTLDGMYVSRKILIDGELPFEEANYCKFNYDTDWQLVPLNNGADTFQFHLTPGEHTIRFEVTLGEMGDIVRQVADVLDAINDDYLEILKLTGASPDSYRDYGFGRVMPHVVEDLVIQSINLNDVISYIESTGEMKSSNSASLTNIARRLEDMGTDEDEIAPNLKNLKTDIGTLGTWINNIKKQPLEFDYVLVQPASAELPKAEGNFFQAFVHEIKQFVGSFFTDYNSLGSATEGVETDRAIEVWAATGRDQAQIIRNLIDNYFIPEYNIAANMKLVSADTLLPSVLAGVGPDVALPGAGADPIQYAIRSAVYALNPEAYVDEADADEEEKAFNAEMREVFADFDEVASRFTEAAFIPISLYGKCYGLPETQSWNMMFYRTDILADLGVDVPKTWDDLMALVPVLQFNNMEIGLSQDYQIFMYQMNEDLWADDGMRINLDSNKSLEAFETMCNYFTQYSLPITYDFANRFKTGEMPIAIQNYTMYNNVVIFGTEIAGLWEFGPVPGMMDEDGNINNTTMSGSSALVMMAGTEDPASAWEFMKWYTDTQFQVDYSNELVAILGDAAKNATANQEALEELPWTSREYEQLMKQMNNLSAVP
ncbi:MAG: extracellular solute-binding protein, partial [Firmicutes bacterium]|nr:extracellular solute-binding protein [Bacillota bacterium]